MLAHVMLSRITSLKIFSDICVHATNCYKSLHLAHASKSVLQVTTSILWYYLNFYVLICRFHSFLKIYLMYITSYNIP